MNKKKSLVIMCLGILVLVHLECKNDRFSFLETANKNFAILLEYEEETVTIGESPQKLELTAALQSAMSPVVSRQKITIGINENGTSEWTIVEQKPKKPFIVPNDCPPDRSRKIKKTKIINGDISQYDENDKLLNSFKLNMPSFINLVKAVKKNGNKLDRKLYAQFFGGGNPGSWSKKEMVEIEPGVSLYTKTFGASDGVGPEWYGKKMYCYYETTTMSPLAQFILDENGHWMSRRVIRYSQDPNLLIPEVTQDELYETNKEGHTIVTKVIKHHEAIINSVNM